RLQALANAPAQLWVVLGRHRPMGCGWIGGDDPGPRDGSRDRDPPPGDAGLSAAFHPLLWRSNLPAAASNRCAEASPDRHRRPAGGNPPGYPALPPPPPPTPP